MSYMGKLLSTDSSSNDETLNAFYGFRIDTLTGSLYVDVIDDDTMVIKLPDPNYIKDVDDYRDFFWQKQSDATFQWGQNGHLEVKYT